MIVSQIARRSVCVCASKGALRRASSTTTSHALHLSNEPIHKSLSIQQTRNSSNDELQSNRAAFKTMPVDLKLLEYIQRIGVGIPKRNKRKRPSRRKQYSRKHDTTVLDTQEELDFFRQRIGNLKKERRARKKRPLSDSRAAVSSCLPPPPFASTPSHKGDADETSVEGYKVKRRPVKVIGWAGALGERFPKNKGLPEVVSLT